MISISIISASLKHASVAASSVVNYYFKMITYYTHSLKCNNRSALITPSISLLTGIPCLHQPENNKLCLSS